MLASALPASAPAYQLSQVVAFELLTKPATCYRVALDGAVQQVLATRPHPMRCLGVWYDLTLFNTETGQVDDIVLREDAPIFLVAEPDEVGT